MKVLELFAGTRSIGKAFERRGHDVTSVDTDPRFKECIHRDAYSFTVEEMKEYDVIWASPDCRTYSRATHCHRKGIEPISEYAEECDLNNAILVKRLKATDRLFFIENPQGALRKMPFMDGLPCYLLTYCTYGHPFRKATNIWTNHPDPQFKEPCKVGGDCHSHKISGNSCLHGPARAAIPDLLCDHIVDICESYHKV